MFLSAFKKGLILFSFSFFYLPVVFAEPQEERTNSGELLQKLKTYLIPVKTKKDEYSEEEVKYYLSIKDKCEKHKAKATECCISPNRCTGLLTSVTQNAAPVLPALYGAYKAFKISDDARKEKYSREEAAAKMCDARNEAVMGSYLGGVLSQLGTFLQKTCKDKIKKCQAQCNAEVQAFREDFRDYFFPIIPRNTVEEIIAFAKDCNENPPRSFRIPNSADTKKTIEYDQTTIEDDQINPHAINDFTKYMNCSSGKDPFNIPKKEIGYVLLFAKAYANSSIAEDKELMLSEKSDEKQIVDCAKQKDRVVTSRNRPAPVPQGAISLCQQVAKQVIPPSAPPPSGSTSPDDPLHTSTLAGGTLNKSGKGSPFFMDPNTPYGIVPDPEGIDDGLPGLSKKPPPSSNRYGFGPSSSNDGGGPGGIGPSGGAGSTDGGSDNSPDEEESEDSESDSGSDGGSIPASFAGSGDYPSSFSDGGYGNSYSQRPVAALSPDSLKNMDPMSFLGNDEKNSDTKTGKSIFQLASQRIQQFCSDRSCTE